ncbi:adenosine deaminase family protein [Corynebacterium comes]|nr:adenosine deaminase family protein [Corynebacterium comes]
MHDTADISPDRKTVNREVLAGLPKVLIHDHLAGAPAQTPETLTAQVRDQLTELAADNVVYVELRISPELHTEGGLTLQEVVDCAVAGLDVPRIDARLILTAQRGRLVSEIAELAVRNHGRKVVGFDVAGPEVHSAGTDADAFRKLREAYVPFTMHSGPDGDIDSIAEAVQLGATRLSHAVALVDDFYIDTEGFEGVLPGRVSGWVRDRHLTLEFAPTLEVHLGAAEELGDHPLTLLQQLGFTCTVNTGNRTVAGSLTDQFVALADTFGYGPEEFFDLTVNAVQGAFLTEVERQDLLERVILPAYEAQDFEDDPSS